MTDKPKYIKASNTLKKKVGDGGIPAYLLERSQHYLENNAVDFAPHAIGYVTELTRIKSDIDSGKTELAPAIDRIVNLIMQLKANGSMFQYQLISMMSNVLLKFLEHVDHTNKDFLDIIDTYTKTMNTILNKKLRGNGGKEGYALTQELKNACERYYTKYKIDR